MNARLITVWFITYNYVHVRPDQFNFQEDGFFSKFEGRSVGKKKENKKNPQFSALALIINNNFL